MQFARVAALFLLLATLPPSAVTRGKAASISGNGPRRHRGGQASPLPPTPAIREHGAFHIDFRLPTSQEGNAVAVVGDWQEHGENLPHSSALWTLDPLSGKVNRLFHGACFQFRVGWQPGGKRLAFTGNDYGYETGTLHNTLSLWIADAASGRKIEAAPVSKTWYVNRLAWSPDGRWLAYDRVVRPDSLSSDDEINEVGIWIVSADGRRSLRLPVPPGIAAFELVGWRPGSNDLYVSEPYPYEGRHLWISDLQGHVHRLAAPATRPDLVDTPRRGRCFSVRIRGRDRFMDGWVDRGIDHLSTFFTDGESALDLGSIAQAQGVRWSPDGRRLAYSETYARVGPVILHLLSADGTNRSELTVRYGSVYQSTDILWSPNGRQILVRSEQYYIVDPNRKLVHVLSTPYRPCSWRADNRLICEGGDRVVILNQDGSVKQLFPPEAFTSV